MPFRFFEHNDMTNLKLPSQFILEKEVIVNGYVIKVFVIIELVINEFVIIRSVINELFTNEFIICELIIIE